MATDIAFALGVLALVGSRVPVGLKVFLTALAIADDLGAVLVIAIFYTDRVSLLALGAEGVLLVLLFLALRFTHRWYSLYVLLAIGVWAAMLASGVHATVAGILVALTIPVRARSSPTSSWRPSAGRPPGSSRRRSPGRAWSAIASRWRPSRTSAPPRSTSSRPASRWSATSTR